MPKFLIVRPMIKSETILMEDQNKFWLGVGILFFLVKHSRPDVSSMARELSKAKDGANPEAYKESLHIIRYVLDVTISV